MVAAQLALGWVVLTMGDRADALRRSVGSLTTADPDTAVLVVHNGGGAVAVSADTRSLVSEINLGVPGGRDVGLRSMGAEVIGFLDDDAEFRGDIEAVRLEFENRPDRGAVALRLVDEHGRTSRRHIPRSGAKALDRNAEVAYFLGGACAIRRSAYEDVGGYFTELFYGHEEIELAWRLIDAGWSIGYLDDVEVFHPFTEISRHADGWQLTGRNRVWIARRTLPWPVALVHVSVWFALGAWRAPKGPCRRSYMHGWWSGWSGPIEHRPIRWRTVVALAKLGRPPII